MDSFAIKHNRNKLGFHTSQRDAYSEVCPLLQLPMYFRCIYIPGLQLRRYRKELAVCVDQKYDQVASTSFKRVVGKCKIRVHCNAW